MLEIINKPDSLSRARIEPSSQLKRKWEQELDAQAGASDHSVSQKRRRKTVIASAQSVDSGSSDETRASNSQNVKAKPRLSHSVGLGRESTNYIDLGHDDLDPGVHIPNPSEAAASTYQSNGRLLSDRLSAGGNATAPSVRLKGKQRMASFTTENLMKDILEPFSKASTGSPKPLSFGVRKAKTVTGRNLTRTASPLQTATSSPQGLSAPTMHNSSLKIESPEGGVRSSMAYLQHGTSATDRLSQPKFSDAAEGTSFKRRGAVSNSPLRHASPTFLKPLKMVAKSTQSVQRNPKLFSQDLSSHVAANDNLYRDQVPGFGSPNQLAELHDDDLAAQQLVDKAPILNQHAGDGIARSGPLYRGDQMPLGGRSMSDFDADAGSTQRPPESSGSDFEVVPIQRRQLMRDATSPPGLKANDRALESPKVKLTKQAGSFSHVSFDSASDQTRANVVAPASDAEALQLDASDYSGDSDSQDPPPLMSGFARLRGAIRQGMAARQRSLTPLFQRDTVVRGVPSEVSVPPTPILNLTDQEEENMQLPPELEDDQQKASGHKGAQDKESEISILNSFPVLLPPQPTRSNAQSPLRQSYSHDESTHTHFTSSSGHVEVPINGLFMANTVKEETRNFQVLSEVREVVDRHLTDLHNDHQYRVQAELIRAHQYKTPDLKPLETRANLPSAAPNGMMGIVHKTSPFQHMKPIEVPVKGDPGPGYIQMSMEKFSTDIFSKGKATKPIFKRDVAFPVSTHVAKPEIPSYTGETPSYTQYVSLKQNVLGRNDKQMHVWPYFQFEGNYVPGEGKVYCDLRSAFDVDVEQWPRKVHRTQQVQTYAPYVESLLEEIGSSMSDVLYYLLESDHEAIESASAGCRAREDLCKEDMNRSSSRWVKVFSNLPRPSPEGLRKAALVCTAFSEALPQFTDHSADLTIWHIARKSSAAHLPENNHEDHIQAGPHALTCQICHLHDCPYHGEVREHEHSSEGDDNESNDEDAQDGDYPPNINHKMRVTLPDRTFEDAQNDLTQPAKPHKGKKTTEWWTANSLTWNHSERGPFYPCFHPGQSCDHAECRCFREQVSCEKACACPASCDRRLRGCSCKRGGKKRCLDDDKCECYKLNRECDPDLCGTCGVDFVLNSADQDEDRVADSCCRNAGIQLGRPKRTILGTSKVHGFGLYAGQNIKKDDFVGEYKGEIISKTETERRGTIYEVQKLSYLFILNRDQELDSQRFGNKIRFINHADPDSRSRNVGPKIMLCNMVHRIGMYALKDIPEGQELYFDYGKDYHQHLVGRDPNEPEGVVPKTKNRALVNTFRDPEAANKERQVTNDRSRSKMPTAAKKRGRPSLAFQNQHVSTSKSREADPSPSKSEGLSAGGRKRSARKSIHPSGRRGGLMRGSKAQPQQAESIASTGGRGGNGKIHRRTRRRGQDDDGDEIMVDVGPVPHQTQVRDTEDEASEFEIPDSAAEEASEEPESPRRSTREKRRSLRARANEE